LTPLTSCPKKPALAQTSDVVLKTGLGLKTGLRTKFLVLVLAKAVLVLTLNGLKDLKNCGLKTIIVLRPFYRPKRS